MDTVAAGPDRRRIAARSLAAGGVLLLAALLFRMFSGLHSPDHGPYRIGWENDPPEQFAGSDGVPTGLAIEVIREAARRQGIELKWIRHDESSEAALRAGAVDLWPLMTITPRRLKILHISAPYLDSVVSFLVLDGHFRRMENLAGQRVGYVSKMPPGFVPVPINLRLLLQYVPTASAVLRNTPRELMASLCRGEVAAAFLEQSAVIHELMSGINCGNQGLSVLTIPASRISLGVGSTMQAGAAADAIRDEIDGMAADGWLARAFSRWGYLSGRSVSYVDALLALRERERRARAAAGVLAVLFVLALWQTWRLVRERRRASRAEERLRLLAHALRSADECIGILDTENRFVYVNEAFLQTFEYGESEIAGQPATVLFSLRPERMPGTDVLAGIASKHWHGEVWNRSRSGREFPVSLSISQVRDERGKCIAAVGIVSDISARKRAEGEYQALQAQYLQAQKLESIGQLAGGVAHDFNNLLTVILGYSKMLLSTVDQNHPFEPPLGQIAAAAERAAALTRQLLTFSRRSASAPKTISLAGIVEDIEPMLSRLIEESIEVFLKAGPDSGFIFADPGMIEQVIVNLVVNARDAMPEGGKLYIETSRVTVSAEFGSHGLGVPQGVYESLSVTDTGKGMTAEVQSRLFEPFFTTKGPGEGTGLGLSTVYGIVKQSGGIITVHSETGIGTCMRAFFPAVDAERPDAASAEHIAAPARGYETVLLVEDESGVRHYVHQVLENHGYRVLDAAGGKEAVEIARCYEGRIDLLFTDMVLPGMNGMEVIRQVLTFRPGIPVLRMSGYPDRFGVQIGDGIPHLQKPFEPAVLLHRIRGIMDSSCVPTQ